MEPEQQKIQNERDALDKHLDEQGFSTQIVIDEIGPKCLENLLLGLAVMEQQIEQAAEAAKKGDQLLACQLLGAGARITKDDIYAVLMESYGGPQAFLQRGLQGVPTLLRDYIKGKYDGGEKRCEFLFNL